MNHTMQQQPATLHSLVPGYLPIAEDERERRLFDEQTRTLGGDVRANINYTLRIMAKEWPGGSFEAILNIIANEVLQLLPASSAHHQVVASASSADTAPAGGSGIYVASRASSPARPAMWRTLRKAGWPIISTWIDEAGEGETKSLAELWHRIEHEIRGSRGLILYAEPSDFPLKGAYLEAGIAIGAGKPVAVVMPGVQLEPVSDRPMGSWIRHPLVTICETLDEARAVVEAPSVPAAGAAAPVAEAVASQPVQPTPDVRAARAKDLLDRFERQAHRMGELWEQCQGKGWPEKEGAAFERLRDVSQPAVRRELLDLLADPTLDAPRLDWLLHVISGAELRRIGVHHSAGVSRPDVDAAMACFTATEAH